MSQYNLERFVRAQLEHYGTALAEIRAGAKRTHWMWFVFPQIAGLGRSETAKYYAISGYDEAKAYLQHPQLGRHLVEICEALLALPTNDAGQVFGHPDNMKLRSSMTLFCAADPECPLFSRVLEKFFAGERDPLTRRILREQALG